MGLFSGKSTETHGFTPAIMGGKPGKLVNVTFNLGEVDLKEAGHLAPPYPPSTTFNNVLEGCNLLNEDTQWERLT